MKPFLEKTLEQISEQPLHQTLKQYRLIALISIAFIGYLMYDLAMWYKTVATTLSVEATAALFGYQLSLLGAFVKSFNNIREKHEE
mgnify:CR=1 FL=1